MASEAYRPLADKERQALLAMLRTADSLRDLLVALGKIGWAPVDSGSWEQMLETWDDGREVIRALATDTHSLVKLDGWELRFEAWLKAGRP